MENSCEASLLHNTSAFRFQGDLPICHIGFHCQLFRMMFLFLFFLKNNKIWIMKTNNLNGACTSHLIYYLYNGWLESNGQAK